VVHAGYEVDDIQRAITVQLRHGGYATSHLYYRPDASRSIVDVLAGAELYTQKRFHENAEAAVRTS
jgi:hypothetical protein